MKLGIAFSAILVGSAAAFGPSPVTFARTQRRGTVRNESQHSLVLADGSCIQDWWRQQHRLLRKIVLWIHRWQCIYDARVSREHSLQGCPFCLVTCYSSRATKTVANAPPRPSQPFAIAMISDREFPTPRSNTTRKQTKPYRVTGDDAPSSRTRVYCFRRTDPSLIHG